VERADTGLLGGLWAPTWAAVGLWMVAAGATLAVTDAARYARAALGAPPAITVSLLINIKSLFWKNCPSGNFISKTLRE